MTPAARAVPTASERGAESEVAHKWATWLPSNLAKKIVFLTGKENFVLLGSQYLVKSSEPSKLLPRKKPPNSKGRETKRIGYLTPAFSGAHKW